MLYLRPVKRPYSLFYGPPVGLTASLEHRLEGSLEGTSGGISYVFLLCFTALLKKLRWLYIIKLFLSAASI